MTGKNRRGAESAPIAAAALAVGEAANYMRISRAGVWRLLKDGKLPRTRIGGRTLIRRAALDAFLERCEEAA